MNRTGLLGVSLVSAVPGAILAVLMVLAFVNYAGGPGILTKVLAGLMLLLGLALAVMPAAVWLFLAPKAAESATSSANVAEADRPGGGSRPAGDDLADHAPPGDEPPGDEPLVDEPAVPGQPGDGQDLNAEAAFSAESGDEIDLGTDFVVDEDDQARPR